MFFKKERYQQTRSNGANFPDDRPDIYAATQMPSQQNEPTFIANDLNIDGNIQSRGELHIDGTLNGQLRAEVCVVDVSGRVRGQIEANSVYIYGSVEGPIIANHVQIYAGAVVRSDIYHRTIGIENGADVLGNFMRQDQNQGHRSATYVAPQQPVASPVAKPDHYNNTAGTDFFTQVLGESASKSDGQSNQSPIVVVKPKMAQKG